jgi:autotransporter-associated beta strand protein
MRARSKRARILRLGPPLPVYIQQRRAKTFDLAAARAITLNGPGGGFAGGGTIDANGFQTTIAQGITGAGGLTVTDGSGSGAGRVIPTASNSYGGGTAIAAGTPAWQGRCGPAASSATSPTAPAVAQDSLPTRKTGPAPASCPLFSPSVWGRFFGQTIDNH